MPVIILLSVKHVERKIASYCLFFAGHSTSCGDPHSKRPWRPGRLQGILASFGVRARVRFLIPDSGTRQRAVSSAESTTWSSPVSPVRDILGTSAILELMFSLTLPCMAVALTAAHVF